MKKQIVKAFDDLRARGKNPNFLYIGDSVLHVASFNSFVRFMHDRGISLCGVICNGIPLNRLKQYEEDSILGLPKDDYVYLENGKDVDLREYPVETITDTAQLFFNLMRQKNISSSDTGLDVLTEDAASKFYILYPGTDRLREHIWNEAFLSGKAPVRVVLEEGVGTYTQTPRTWFDLTIAKTHSKLGRLLKYIRWYVMLPFRKILDRLLQKKTQYVRFCVFDYDSHGRLVANEAAAQNLSEIFRIAGEQEGIPPKDFKDKIVIATTMLFEESSSQALETDVYSKVIDMCRNHGMDVVIKPHPRDNSLDKYRQLGAQVIDDTKVSLESLLAYANNMPLAIIGMQSSSQVIANSLWGVPAVFLTDLCEEAFLQHDDNPRIKHFRLSCSRGEPLFSQFASSPQSYNELEGCIVAIADRRSPVVSE